MSNSFKYVYGVCWRHYKTNYVINDAILYWRHFALIFSHMQLMDKNNQYSKNHIFYPLVYLLRCYLIVRLKVGRRQYNKCKLTTWLSDTTNLYRYYLNFWISIHLNQNEPHYAPTFLNNYYWHLYWQWISLVSESDFLCGLSTKMHKALKRFLWNPQDTRRIM